MPELPEAERAREALARHALGRVVADADDSDAYVCRPWPPGGIREALVGHKVTGVERVGKQLLLETDGPVLQSGGKLHSRIRSRFTGGIVYSWVVVSCWRSCRPRSWSGSWRSPAQR